jgi:cardiolipin synthase
MLAPPRPAQSRGNRPLVGSWVKDDTAEPHRRDDPAMPWWMLLVVVVAAAAIIVVINLATPEKKLAYEIRPDFAVDDACFLRLVSCLLGPPLTQGNQVTALHNGDRIFPAMLSAIASARVSVCFETYIYWAGDIGRRFTDALCERALAGVAVHVVLDGVGTRLDNAQLGKMRDAGIQIERFHPLRLRFLGSINNRTHRKLLVVDGRVGFTGGVGIADQWQGDAQDADHWRDMHFRIDGPAVAQMQAAFMDNWLKTRAALLHGDKYFPAIERRDGGVSAQLFRSSPDEGAESVRLLYLLSIACAKRSIRIANAYFVPDDLARDTLVSALRRGVRVQLILPGALIDARVTRHASRSRWGPILAAGAEIHEFQPTMFHCKAMIVDDLWVTVGSTNFDNRSFRLNDEANLNVHDAGFAAELAAVFDADLTRSRRITYEEWKRRPLHEKAGERLAGFLRSQL